MNNMREQLTMNGIMMSEGEIIATDVMAELNKDNNTIRYSYGSDMGTRWGTIGYNPTTTPVYNSNNKITGLLSNMPEETNNWYLFWND